MKKKQAIMLCAELIGIELIELLNVGMAYSDSTKDCIPVMYDPFLPENAHQTNEIIVKLEIDVRISRGTKNNSWIADTPLKRYVSGYGIDRNTAIYKCICAYFDLEYEA